MEKIAIITDSAADLSEEYIAENNIYITNLYVVIDDKYYEDRAEINADQLVEINESGDEHTAKTSAPSPTDFSNVFEKVKEDGYEKAIYIGLNPKLSATFSNANLAEKHGLDIRMVDSGSVTLVEGIIVIYAVDLLKEELEINEIIKRLESVIGSQKAYAYFDTLKYLKAGGRLGKVAKHASSIFNIKPVLSLDGQGDFNLVKLKATRQKAYDIIGKKVREDLVKAKKYYLSYISGKDTTVIDDLREKISDLETKAIAINQSRFGSVISAHAGSKTFAISYLIIND